MSVYAVIHTGGKQYRVSPGDVVQVEKLAAKAGETVEIDNVYLLGNEGEVSVGTPVLKDARVVAQVESEGRGDKIIVFKHKRRKGYRKTMGHRQSFTSLKITKIVHGKSVFKEEPEKLKEKEKAAVAVAAAAAAAKKAERAKAKEEKKTAVKAAPKPVAEAKPEKKIEAAPPPAEKPIPVPEAPKAEAAPEPPVTTKPIAEPTVQRSAPEASPEPPADLTVTREPEIPVAPPAVEKPLPVAEPATEVRPRETERKEKATSDKSLWWIIAAVIAALALLAFLLMNWLSPGTEPGTGPQPKAVQPAKEEKGKAKPRVRDIKLEKTAPVDKPAAPAQPPD